MGAKTAAELEIQEAIIPLRALLELGDADEAAGLRYKEELEEALAVLTT